MAVSNYQIFNQWKYIAITKILMNFFT